MDADFCMHHTLCRPEWTEDQQGTLATDGEWCDVCRGMTTVTSYIDGGGGGDTLSGRLRRSGGGITGGSDEEGLASYSSLQV